MVIGIRKGGTEGQTWNPVSRTPVSKEVVSFAAWIMRATFAGGANAS